MIIDNGLKSIITHLNENYIEISHTFDDRYTSARTTFIDLRNKKKTNKMLTLLEYL